MKWFQIKEKSAGKKRLLLCWYLYRILGTGIVKVIAFFVALFTYMLNNDLRSYSHNYFKILHSYTNENKHFPSFQHQFLHVLSYAYSLIDKMEAFGGRFNEKRITFDNRILEEEIFTNIANRKGIFFICNHIGNVEVMRALIHSKKNKVTPNISIFLQKSQCQVFNSFINEIVKENINITSYPIEDIDMSTAIEIEEKLTQGGIVFMAGDRIPANNTLKTTKISMLNKQIELPIGVFKFAKLVPAEIYFVSCLKEIDGYKVYLSKPESRDVKLLQEKFVAFMTDMILKQPTQFYHFYDIFENEKEI